MNPKILSTKIKTNWTDADSTAFWNFICGEGLCAATALNFKNEGMKFAVEESDLLIITGAVNEKMFEVLKNIRARMLKPNFCIVLGNCSCGSENSILGETDFPIDYFITGCPADIKLLRQALAALSQGNS